MNKISIRFSLTERCIADLMTISMNGESSREFNSQTYVKTFEKSSHLQRSSYMKQEENNVKNNSSNKRSHYFLHVSFITFYIFHFKLYFKVLFSYSPLYRWRLLSLTWSFYSSLLYLYLYFSFISFPLCLFLIQYIRPTFYNWMTYFSWSLDDISLLVGTNLLSSIAATSLFFWSCF